MKKDMGASTGSREPSQSSTCLGPSGFDPARIIRIASQLTHQQRRDLLASNDGVWWSADGRVSRAMHRKGLVEAASWSGSALFTPLGLEVRAAIVTEAGTAETPQSGSVHEGAGPKDIAQSSGETPNA